ncbi:alpha/beta fold hydrolase [Halobacillus seohaensis]|uniref:Alpha/beta fold hydrolase n=1 Tax=Halobacillus seohaensis TaxID=447421 RepID=A0ABW2EKX0_9BACI
MPFYTNVDGQRIFYEDHGVGNVILFIHPPGMGRKVFEQQQELAEHYRIILPDLSGHGDSDTVKLSPEISDYTLEILSLIDHLQLDQIILFGYSAGGAVAQDFTLSNPNRVKGLILSGAFPKVDTKILAFQFEIGMQWVRENPDSLAQVLSQTHFQDTVTREEQRHHMLKSDPIVWYEFYKHSSQYDCSKQLEKIQVPILLLYGKRSFWVYHHARFYRRCSKASLTVVDNAFHQLPATQGPTVNLAVRDFFSRTFVKRK